MCYGSGYRGNLSISEWRQTLRRVEITIKQTLLSQTAASRFASRDFYIHKHLGYRGYSWRIESAASAQPKAGFTHPKTTVP